MRSKSTPWSTSTNLASHFLRASSLAASLSTSSAALPAPEASTCFLQYSMTLARILLVTLGRGMVLSAQSSSIMCLMVWDSRATVSSTSKVSPSDDFRTIFFGVDMVSGSRF
ncbi:hypothetical protein RHGRI_013382 [Rhododendron griersonianum]|uniref:Secreted protein n=1 Tax=Rhododendron griersonianum TaxID=479676 RepID=A0AAV6K5G3_9ERIC|nr:hypothetical protein RHGRI_013382 [Rhododendron griersonianum]